MEHHDSAIAFINSPLSRKTDQLLSVALPNLISYELIDTRN
ncbi:hypothetical protein OGM63_21620 [Plectonema radiosum NIES-515]|uniref:Uncharacterized protein n=1 Tax=Plectonema radiosum NIES-515 TaxID=2986073 RepID=A0ABT3B3Y0_9CYAN|nr:hypothetical protein [Plectonema radiosum]MCV3216076.1 hypothetical protein [Plectonema radiosum NIES-515]